MIRFLKIPGDEVKDIKPGTIMIFKSQIVIFLWYGLSERESNLCRYKLIKSYFNPDNFNPDRSWEKPEDFNYSSSIYSILCDMILVDESILDKEIIAYRDEIMQNKKLQQKLIKWYDYNFVFENVLQRYDKGISSTQGNDSRHLSTLLG